MFYGPHGEHRLNQNQEPLLMTETFICPQVNGGPGSRRSFVDYSHTPTPKAPGFSIPDVHEVASNWNRLGTGYQLATCITTTDPGYQGLRTISQAMELPGGEHILGIHIEGPYFAKAARGAHPERCIVPPSVEHFQRLQDLAQGRIVLVTLAPEQPGALKLIEYLAANGVAVSIGHSDLRRNHFNDAVSAGATMVTHVGNALPLDKAEKAALKAFWALLHRRGYATQFKDRGISDMQVGDVLRETGARSEIVDLIHGYLTDKRVSPMIITDRVHLTDEFTRVIVAVHGLDNLIVVSDASPLAYARPGKYTIFNGLDVTVKWPTLDGDAGFPCGEPLSGSYWGLLDCINVFSALFPDVTKEQLLLLGRDNVLKALAGPLKRIGTSPNSRPIPEADQIVWNPETRRFKVGV